MSDSKESRRSFLKSSMAAAASPVTEAQSVAEAHHGAGPAKPSTPPNIILYLADQFRWDFVGACVLIVGELEHAIGVSNRAQSCGSCQNGTVRTEEG
jgi:hypothetical protein